MQCFLIRCGRWLSLALCALLALLAAGCGNGGGIADLDDVAISSRDVPTDWVPADFDEEEGRGLFDLLPQLLVANSDARLFLQALGDDAGRHGVATILIQTSDPAALPQSTESERLLEPLARLLLRQDALLGPDVRGGDPGTYVAVSDVPVPDSLRSRLVRLLDDQRLFSDGAIFTVGPVLALVTIWYPEQEGPFRELDDLASEVARRLQVYLGEG